MLQVSFVRGRVDKGTVDRDLWSEICGQTGRRFVVEICGQEICGQTGSVSEIDRRSAKNLYGRAQEFRMIHL